MTTKSNELKIDKGIKMPSGWGRSKGSAYTDAMKIMDIGDSFLCPISFRGNLSGIARGLQIKVSCRKWDNKNVRVWRTA